MTNKKLIIIFVCIFIVFAVGAFVINSIEPTEDLAVITVNGEFYREVDLTKEDNFVIETEKGYNTISVKNNMIYVTEATCPDQLCVRHGELHNKYDAIVCLPNKVVIEYKTDSGIDAIAGR